MKLGDSVMTPAGGGIVESVDYVHGMVLVRLTLWDTLVSYKLEEVSVR